MRRLFCLILGGVVLTGGTVVAWQFDRGDKIIQDHVVSQLVKAVKGKDLIAIVQDRYPHGWATNKTVDISYSQASVLGLTAAIPVESLKGDNISVCVQGCSLFYTPGSQMHPSGPWLVFAHSQREPLTQWINNFMRSDDNEQIAKDARALPPDEFWTKYKLWQVFSNGVYETTYGCLFLVEHPMFEKPDEKEKEGRSNLFFSSREVSEIVYLAYLYEDKGGGAAKYAEAVRQSRILQPMPKAEFKTLIGQKLHAALSDPEYGMAEKRAKEEKERKQRELAERKAKLRAEIDMRMDVIEKAAQVTADDFIQLDVVFVQFAILPP